MILTKKKSLEGFTKKLQEANQKEFIVEKVIKRKGDKLSVRRKGYNKSFNSWIDKKNIIWINEYFPEPNLLAGKVTTELHLSNFARN